MTLDAPEGVMRALLNDEQGVNSSRARVPCLSRRAGIGDASPAAQAWLLRGAAKAALQLTGSRAPVPRCKRHFATPRLVTYSTCGAKAVVWASVLSPELSPFIRRGEANMT
jgi:hypothetical protein